jgi:hypothetical protein
MCSARTGSCYARIPEKGRPVAWDSLRTLDWETSVLDVLARDHLLLPRALPPNVAAR